MEELMNRMRVCSILFVILKALAILLCLYSLLKCLAIAFLPRKSQNNRDQNKYKTFNESVGEVNWINKNNRRRAWNIQSLQKSPTKNDHFESLYQPQGIILYNPLLVLSHTDSYLLGILFNILGLILFMMSPNSITGVDVKVIYMEGCYLDSVISFVYICLFWHLSV